MLPLLPLLLGLVAPAAAAGGRTELQLRDGSRVVGELIDVKDGRYWVLLDDGNMTSVATADVVRVSEPGAATVPLPEPVPVEPEEPHRAFGAGFEAGLVSGVRARFHVDWPYVDHVDARVGAASFSNVGSTLIGLTGGEVALFKKGTSHLALSLDVGYSLYESSALFGAGVAYLYDPRGAFEMRIGVIGSAPTSASIIPVLSGAWMW